MLIQQTDTVTYVVSEKDYESGEEIQLRLIDTKRLDQHITILNQEMFETIRKAVKDIL